MYSVKEYMGIWLRFSKLVAPFWGHHYPKRWGHENHLILENLYGTEATLLDPGFLGQPFQRVTAMIPYLCEIHTCTMKQDHQARKS